MRACYIGLLAFEEEKKRKGKEALEMVLG